MNESLHEPVSIVYSNGDLQGIQLADSIHAINLFTSGGDIRSVYSHCHVDSLAFTEQNVINQNAHTSLTTLCSHFLLSYGNQAMTKSAHWWSQSRGVSSRKKTPEGQTESHKVHFFHINKSVGEMVIMNDLE